MSEPSGDHHQRGRLRYGVFCRGFRDVHGLRGGAGRWGRVGRQHREAFFWAGLDAGAAGDAAQPVDPPSPGLLRDGDGLRGAFPRAERAEDARVRMRHPDRTPCGGEGLRPFEGVHGAGGLRKEAAQYHPQHLQLVEWHLGITFPCSLCRGLSRGLLWGRRPVRTLRAS